MENGLVVIKKLNKEEVPVTTSKTVAHLTKMKNRTVYLLIEKYKSDFERFGNISFQMIKLDKKRGAPEKVYYINEQQFLLLVTYMRNNDLVRELKITLIQQFEKMKNLIQERQTLEWKETRQLGKQENRNMNDKIKEFIEYAERQGSKNFKRYYSNFAKLSNKSVGIPNGMRDTVNCKKLFFHIATMGIIEEKLHEGIAKGKHYKEIYQDCKKQIEEFDKFIPASLRLN